MELKRRFYYHTVTVGYLLIVPYGIETRVFVLEYLHYRLLIVPYGIETLDAPAAERPARNF